MAIRAVLFDIGGVLELTHDGEEPTVGLRKLFFDWSARLGLDVSGLGQAVRSISVDGLVGRCTEDEWWARLAILTGTSLDDLGQLREDFWREYLGILNTELLEFFVSLRTDYKTGLLSNSFVGAREREREAYGFEQHAELIVYSHEVGMKKPEPEIYRLACERLEVAPEQTLFLDDLDSYIAGAAAVGLVTVKFENTAQAIADIHAALEAR